MTSNGALMVDAILGDEKRAGETLYNALTGKPVSASSAVDAAITIGSDALMVVPGLGAAAAAFKAGRVAKAATRGAKAVSKLEKVESQRRSLKNASIAAKKYPGIKFSGAESVKLTQLTKKSAQLKDQISKAAKKAGIRENPTKNRFDKVYETQSEKRIAMKNKRNSPRRKKARYTGHVISDTANVMQLAREFDEE